MIIDCISDLHGHYPDLEGGDLLIVAGDLTAHGIKSQYIEFIDWIVKQKYTRKVVIAGNHDGVLQKDEYFFHLNRIDEYFDFDYLCDSGEEFHGLKIWGSPWTPEFCGWHFMLDTPEQLAEKWAIIPDDTDILITHGPPLGIRDENNYDGRLGCSELRKKVDSLPNLKLHVFGHIHEGYGQETINKTTFVNCAHMDIKYRPMNQPIRIVL